MTGDDWAWVAVGTGIALFTFVGALAERIAKRPRLALLPLHIIVSVAGSAGIVVLIPILICLSLIPFYLLGAFLLFMGVWNDPASESACQIYGWIPHLANCS